MKNRIKGIILAVLIIGILLIPSIPVYADESWGYYLEFTVQDTSGTDRTNVPVILSSLIGSNLVNAGYIDSDGLDTNLKETTTAMEYLLSTTNGAMVIPNLAASQTRTYRLYMNDSPGQHGFPIIVGNEGYMTVVDADTLELGDNFEIEVSGYVDTSSDGYVVYKQDAFDILCSSDDIIATIYDTTYVATYPQVVATTQGTSATGTSHTLTLPNGNANDLIIVWVGGSNATSTVTWGSGWTELFDATAGVAFISAGYLIDDNSTDGTLTVTTSATTPLHYICYRITDYSGVPEAGVAASGTSANPNPPSLTASWGSAANLWIVGEVAPFTVSSYPANYTDGIFQAQLGTAQRERTTATEDPSAYTLANSQYWFANTIVIAPAFEVAVSVTAADITDGEHIIIVNADGTDLNIYVDGVLEDTVALGGASVKDKASNWILFGGNSMSYINYYKQTVGGTLIAHYQPASMITSTTVPDLEGVAQNGTITWGSNSNLTITMMGITPYIEYVSESGSDEVADTIKPATMPDTWYSDITDIANLPFYETFNDKATEMGMPTQTLYVMMMLGTAVAVGLGVLVFTGSALVAILACGVTIAAGVNTGILSGWMMLIYFIFGIGILYLSRQN